MKSTLNTKPQPPVEHTFPALYKCTTSNLVVFADDIETGVVVIGNDSWSLGDYCDMWADFDDSASWQRLPSGSFVTLTQE